ncbi:MAG: glutathione binding-like protein [Pseudomonadota bacterium]|nr:glutathione binding-like protein [Pseudomonadota bacterium]
MITQYTWPTPNGHKVSILISELGLETEIVAIDINSGAQFAPEFLKISPNNRIPAIVDHNPFDSGDAIPVFETGAILMYLAEKEGRFLPGTEDFRARKLVLEWLMWQKGGLGPMAGQAHHFRQSMGGVDVPYGVERYSKEVRRLYGVMNERLGETEWLGGDDYSIADMACWPWVRPSRRQGIDKAEFPNVKRWFDTMSKRKGVQKGMELLADRRGSKEMTDKSRAVLFGKGQFERY